MSAREQSLLLEGPAGTLEALYQSPDAPTGAVLLGGDLALEVGRPSLPVSYTHIRPHETTRKIA